MTLERQLNTVSIIGIAFVTGWLSSAGYYNLTHLWQQKNQLHTIQTTVLPKLKAQANCEHIRAEVNEQIIEEATIGIRPQPGEVSADCPHPATK